ncbi:TPA: restriction endonuclease subunit S, partial [Escherichia coli]
MGSNAITTIIGEHLLIRNGKSSPSRAITGEYPVYGSNGIIGYSDEYNANENTIIIGRVGSYCGSVYISGKKCWVTDNAIIGTAKNENESHFWFYLLKKIDLNNYSTGSGQPLINQTIINTISVTIPKLSEKRVSIGHFLRHFDQKINLSLNINQSLEQMSQTLFKSWFVDFDPVIDNALDAGNPIPEALQSRAELRQKVRSSADFKPLPVEIRSLFPSEFEETELGWVPKGWNISLAGEEFIVKGGSTPSTANEDFWINGTIHWTSPKDLTGNQSKVLLDTAKKITPLGLTKISSGLLPVNTVLMSSRAPIGYLAISKVPMAINQGYIAIPSAKHLSPEYTIYWLDNIMDDIKGMAGGTTFAEISKSAFKTIKLLI